MSITGMPSRPSCGTAVAVHIPLGAQAFLWATGWCASARQPTLDSQRCDACALLHPHQCSCTMTKLHSATSRRKTCLHTCLQPSLLNKGNILQAVCLPSAPLQGKPRLALGSVLTVSLDWKVHATQHIQIEQGLVSGNRRKYFDPVQPQQSCTSRHRRMRPTTTG
jgi:hypothetical protein